MLAFLIVPLVIAVPYLTFQYLDAKSRVSAGEKLVPFHKSRGMMACQHQAVFTITVPAIFLAGPLLEMSSWLPLCLWLAYGAIWIAFCLPASFIHGANKNLLDFYVAFINPLYQMTLVLGCVLPTQMSSPTLFALALLATLAKAGICMSVCLHRFAAHAAFRCGPLTTFALSWLGCMANQGGPIWWASQHRCHHKFCDDKRDPHSPQLMGVVKAFAFFSVPTNQSIIDEFVPPHLDSWPIRVLDTFGYVPVAVELALAYYFGGLAGLWISYTSLWCCQTVTLWFNVVNHPPHTEDQVACVASDHCDSTKVAAPSLFFKYLNLWLFVPGLIGEEAHLHHHDYPRCAERPGWDLPGLLFIKPLQAAGLIWKVQGERPE